MPLAEEDVVNFFEDADQMGLPRKTREQLVEEGIESPLYLVDFSDD